MNKSLILFVIRDHIGVTPLSDLSATLTADLQRIWESLTKPSKLTDSMITDFFTLQFTALPHKVLQPEKFQHSVLELSNRFQDSKDENYVFQPEYHRNVPVDGWSIYAENVWQQIELNKDLDLPTQQILVARFRCEEIAAQALEEFEELYKPIEEQTGVIVDFGLISGEARSKAIETFDLLASRYAESVYEPKRASLVSNLDDRLSRKFLSQLSLLQKEVILSLKAFAKEFLSTPGYNFLLVITTAEDKAKTDFENLAKSMLVRGCSLSYSSELNVLNTEVDELIDILKAEEAKKLTVRVTRKLSGELDETLPVIFKSSSNDIWDRVFLSFESSMNLLLDKYSSEDGYDFRLGGNEEQIRKPFCSYAQPAGSYLGKKWLKTRSRMSFLSGYEIFSKRDFVMMIKECLEFGSHPIESKNCMSMLESTLKLIPLLSTITLDATEEMLYPPSDVSKEMEQDEDWDFENFPVTLTVAQQQNIQSKFKRIADSMYVDAKRSTIQSITQIPLYFYLLLLVLGWNELMAVFKSPLYFTFLLIASAAAYVAYTLNLWGPILTFTNTMVNQVVIIAKEKLKETLDVKPEGHRFPTKYKESEDIPLQDLSEKSSSSAATQE